MQAALQRLGSVAWPAFLGAAVLEVALFALVDPHSLRLPGGAELVLSPTAVYSLAFFVFWAVVGAACAMTQSLARSAADINAGGDRARLSKPGR